MSPLGYTRTNLANNVVRITWQPLDSAEYGDWVELPSFPDKTVQISGTDVTTMVFQGSNEPSGANPQTLIDKDGITLLNAAGIFTLKDNPLYVRPYVTSGLAVQVTMICTGVVKN